MGEPPTFEKHDGLARAGEVSMLPWRYAFLYRDLVEVAREHGYALALHGSMKRDLDLIAVPWTGLAVSAEHLALALRDAAGAAFGEGDPHEKKHGRLAWSLHLGGGPYVDLSVMPKEP